jgi:Ni/Fe-hydrogenase b-type cytochrome subunit
MTATSQSPHSSTRKLVADGAFTLGRLSEGRVLALAAVSPQGSADPVDLATAEALRIERPDLPAVEVDPGDFDPASPERRFSLAMVREFPLDDNQGADLVVMRGNLTSVLKQVKISHEDRSIVRRNADWVSRRGWRPLAVAVARVGEHELIGDFSLVGFVSIGDGSERGSASNGPADWARVNVWSVSLRYQHWINVAMVFILSCTGYFIMDPFFGPSAHSGEETGFLMGWMRLIHFSAGFIWVVIGATRILSAFTSRDRYLRWTQMWPLKRKEDLRNLGKVVQHYALIKNDSPLFLAHNPLQQLTYTSLYLACGLQMATGFILYGLYHQDNPFWAFISTPAHWFGIPGIRLFHAMMMFGLWAFVIMHVYLAVRADSLERHGGLSSMINGGVWLHRGAKPVDAPEIR